MRPRSSGDTAGNSSRNLQKIDLPVSRRVSGETVTSTSRRIAHDLTSTRAEKLLATARSTLTSP
jgi:hypothetical protein